ncbi:MAG: hypothetical protein J7L37_05940 [Thermococcus sp.]|nr:hypothetical protein [Thermococcus sp.]
MKRRGQVFSLDAMIAFVIVILMLGTVTATSEGLRNEITSMVGWYERANIADNMLDVLIKSPGEPANWIDDPSNVRVVGLADNRSSGIVYQKVLKLVNEVENNNSAVKASLVKMCNDKDFELLFFQGKWDFNVSYLWDPTITGTTFWEFMSWPGDCKVAGNKKYDLNYPAVSFCDPLLVTGSLHVVDSESFCVIGDLDGRGSVTYDIGHYPPTSSGSGNIGIDEPYLAIEGDWIVRGAVTVHVEGDIFIEGALIVLGGGTRRVDVAHDMYIFGDSTHAPLFDPGQSFTVTIGISGYSPGNLYVKYGGTWYVAISDPWNADSWYKFNGTEWVQVTLSEFETVVKGNIIPDRKPNGVTVTIDGYLPPNDWQEPMPECWAGGLPLDVTNATANYTFPTNITSEIGAGNLSNVLPGLYKAIVKINDTIIVNPDMNLTMESRENSPWVEFSERRTAMVLLKYDSQKNVTPGGLINILSGTLIFPIPAYYTLSITLPDQNGVYALFMVVDGSTLKVLGVWRVNNIVAGAMWVKTEDRPYLVRVYKGIGGTLLVPWNDLFEDFDPYKGGKIVSLWMYESNAPWVFLRDGGDISPFLTPRVEPVVVQLWVWDDS